MLISIFFIALIATLLSVMSGGGASTITIPSYIALGISSPIALCMQKISSAFWVVPSGYRYLKGKKIDWKFLLFVTLFGMFGVWLGVHLALELPVRVFQIVV